VVVRRNRLAISVRAGRQGVLPWVMQHVHKRTDSLERRMYLCKVPCNLQCYACMHVLVCLAERHV